MVADRPLFTVIVPTRNRPATFAVALQTVLAQRCRDIEVVAVDDGSRVEHRCRYQTLIDAAPEVARLFILPPTARGHGPSFARNYGADHAHGRYLCFLDDDDEWTDPEHLDRAASVIAASNGGIDLILANQRAFCGGSPIADAVWIEDLADRLRRPADTDGAYRVGPRELLEAQGHCHLNTTIVSARLYRELGGFDEALRYEEDRDFYLRAIDKAKSIKYLPEFVSRHNVPDPAAKATLSTIETELSKRLSQLRVFDKAALFSLRPELRRYGMRQRAYVLKHIATEAGRVGQLDCAAYYARQGLAAGPTIGWLAATLAFELRRWAPFATRRRHVSHRSGPEQGRGVI